MSLDVTLDPLVLEATGTPVVSGALDATLGTLVMSAGGTQVAVGTVSRTLGAVTLSATGGVPAPIPGTLRLYASRILDDSSTIVVLDGPPNVVVQWSIEAGAGEITPVGESSTNSAGRAMALYRPLGYSGEVTLRATHSVS